MEARRGKEQGGRFQQAMWRTSNAPLRPGNEIGLLKNGPAAFEDWLAVIGGARRWVHLENYIFADDSVGQRFADALSEKAGEGVPVRVLYDWFGCTDVWVPNSFWRKLRSAGVEVRVVNPPSLYRGPRRFLARDHRKLLGVDGSYASVGIALNSWGFLLPAPGPRMWEYSGNFSRYVARLSARSSCKPIRSGA